MSLKDLFYRRVFQIPDYQRSYSWEHQQVQEFLEDLEFLPSNKHHYTGTIVIHGADSSTDLMDDEGDSYERVDIVDGQQRLTTIILLLDGIRKLLESCSKKSKKLSRGIRKNYISACDMNGQPLYRLSLNSDTDYFFRKNILSDQPGVEGPRIASHIRLNDAKGQIHKYLDVLSNTGSADSETALTGLYTKITRQLRFTLYEVDSQAEVGVIFEVMNDRGKPLTNLEKVKNYLLHVSAKLPFPNDLYAAVNDAWGEIFRQMMAADLTSGADEDGFLRAHWIAYYNPQSRNWSGSKSVKDRFDVRRFVGLERRLLSELQGYAEGLRASCTSYCDACRPGRTDAFAAFADEPKVQQDIMQWSAKLVRVGVMAPLLPLLLSVRKRWSDKPDRYLELLRLFEAFAFRTYGLLSYRADAGQSNLFHLSHQVAAGQCDFASLRREVKSLVRYWDDDGGFGERLDYRKTRNWYKWKALRYFLYEYEIHLAAGRRATPKVSWEDLQKSKYLESIEHVLPQTIEDQEYWTKRFTSKEHTQYMHDIGNLTLTRHNSYYSNISFPRKRGSAEQESPCYANSPLFVERELVKEKKWNVKSIKRRRRRLCKWAKSRWKVDFDELAENEAAVAGGELADDQ